MSPADLKSLLGTIVAELNSVADYGGIVDPALIPLIAIGKAVDKEIPGLVAGVAGWISGNPPTPEELADFQSKLGTLGDPNLP